MAFETLQSENVRQTSLKRVLNWNQIYQTCYHLLLSCFLLVSLIKGNCRSPVWYRPETEAQEDAKMPFLRITAFFIQRIC